MYKKKLQTPGFFSSSSYLFILIYLNPIAAFSASGY